MKRRIVKEILENERERRTVEDSSLSFFYENAHLPFCIPIQHTDEFIEPDADTINALSL
jgi:hypothetical protein